MLGTDYVLFSISCQRFYIRYWFFFRPATANAFELHVSCSGVRSRARTNAFAYAMGSKLAMLPLVETCVQKRTF